MSKPLRVPKQGQVTTQQEVAAMRLLDQIGQALKESRTDLDELIESGREIRGELIKERYGLAE